MLEEQLEKGNFNPNEYIEELCREKYELMINSHLDNENILFSIKDSMSDNISDIRSMKSQIIDDIKETEALILDYNTNNSESIFKVITDNQTLIEDYTSVSNSIEQLSQNFQEIHDALSSSIVQKSCLSETIRNIKLFNHIKSVKNDPEKLQFTPSGVESLYKQMGLELSVFASDIAFIISSETIFIDTSLAEYKQIFMNIGEVCVKMLEQKLFDSFDKKFFQTVESCSKALSKFTGYKKILWGLANAIVDEEFHQFNLKDSGSEFNKICDCLKEFYAYIATPEVIHDYFFEILFKKCIFKSLEDAQQSINRGAEIYFKDMNTTYMMVKQFMVQLKTLESSYDMTVIDSLMSQTKVKNCLSKYLKDELVYLKDQMEMNFMVLYEGLASKHQIEFRHGLSADKFYHQFGLQLGRDKNLNLSQISILSVNSCSVSLDNAKDMLKRMIKVVDTKAAIPIIQDVADLIEMHIVQRHINEGMKCTLKLHLHQSGIKAGEKIPLLEEVRKSEQIVKKIGNCFKLSLFDSLHENEKKIVAQIVHKLIDEIQNEISLCVSRFLTKLSNTIYTTLNTLQKVSDFKSTTFLEGPTTACLETVNYVTTIADGIRQTLDADLNRSQMLARLGNIVFSRLVDHIKSYRYTTMGASQLILDMSEYRRMAEVLDVSKVIKLFEMLSEMVALLTLSPQNMASAMQSEQMKDFSQTALEEFAKLRID